MSRSLAERSGREYPHNAIYEILTYRMKEEDISEPVEYNKATCEFFYDMIRSSTQEIILCYTDVYGLSLTLDETSKRRKCSPSKVRKCLNEVYFMQDADGFKVNKLRLLSRK